MPSSGDSGNKVDISNPEPLARHNQGQPIRPVLDPQGKPRTKFLTDCTEEHAASLRCIEEHYLEKGVVCQPYFEAYKSCRRQERERRLQQNAKRGFF